MTEPSPPADPFRSGPPPGSAPPPPPEPASAGSTAISADPEPGADQTPPAGYPPPPADYPPPGGYGPPPGYAPPPEFGAAPSGYAPPPGYTPPPDGYAAPPPPGGYAAPPPPAGYPSAQPGQPAPGWPAPGGAGTAAAFDPKTVDPMDWAIIAAGVLAFIFSTFSYYTASVKVAGIGSSTGSESAWHGFFGWFAALLALGGAAVLALEFFAPQVKLPFPGRLLTTGLFAVATLSVLLALIVVPITTSFAGIDIDKGHGIGYWLSLLVIVAGLVLSVLRLQATGGSLPWEKAKTTS